MNEIIFLVGIKKLCVLCAVFLRVLCGFIFTTEGTKFFTENTEKLPDMIKNFFINFDPVHFSSR